MRPKLRLERSDFLRVRREPLVEQRSVPFDHSLESTLLALGAQKPHLARVLGGALGISPSTTPAINDRRALR
jgi:hypothetical protein